MDNDLYSFALKNTLDEIRNLCPDITSAFVFTEEGEITAADENTPHPDITHIIDDLKGLMEEAETMGGIEQIRIEGSEGGANITHMANHYLVTISPENSDKNVNMITRTIVGTVLKLLDKINPASIKNNQRETETKPEVLVKKEEEPVEQPIDEPEMKETEQSFKPEIVHPEPTVNQLMVEDIKGLARARWRDTVLVDEETFLQWQRLNEDLRIEEVEIETFVGQLMKCKAKPTKDSKQGGNGIIQIPQGIQQKLDTKKGELVRVKPIFE